MAFGFLKKLFGSSSSVSSKSSPVLSDKEIDKALLYTKSFTSFNTKGVAIFQMSEEKPHLVKSNFAQSMTAFFVYMWLRKTSVSNNNIYSVLLESLASDLSVSKKEKINFLTTCFNLNLDPYNPNLDKFYSKGKGIINLIATMLPFVDMFIVKDATDIVKYVDSKFGPTAQIDGNLMVSPQDVASIIVRDMHTGLLRQ